MKRSNPKSARKSSKASSAVSTCPAQKNAVAGFRGGQDQTFQAKPHYLPSRKFREHLIALPFVATSGETSCPHAYNNGAHAAVHSILAGLQCDKKVDVTFWLETALGQLADAVRQIKRSAARVVPAQREPRGASSVVSNHRRSGDTESWPPPLVEGYLSIFKIRGRTYHHMVRDGDRIMSACGKEELTREVYLVIKDRTLHWAATHRICPDCERIVEGKSNG